MKRVLGTVFVGIAISTMAACSPTPASPVTVASKEHEAGEWETKKVRTCTGWKARKPHTDANCSKWNDTTVKEWDDEDYVLHLSDGREVEVSAEEFGNWQEGQTYNG